MEAPGTPKSSRTQKLKDRDPLMPKGPVSAYFIYVLENRPSVIAELGGGGTRSTICTRLGESWKALSEAEKTIYKDKFLAQKAEHEKLLKQYNDSGAAAQHQERLAQKQAAAAPTPARARADRAVLDLDRVRGADTDPDLSSVPTQALVRELARRYGIVSVLPFEEAAAAPVPAPALSPVAFAAASTSATASSSFAASAAAVQHVASEAAEAESPAPKKRRKMHTAGDESAAAAPPQPLPQPVSVPASVPALVLQQQRPLPQGVKVWLTKKRWNKIAAELETDDEDKIWDTAITCFQAFPEESREKYIKKEAEAEATAVAKE